MVSAQVIEDVEITAEAIGLSPHRQETANASAGQPTPQLAANAATIAHPTSQLRWGQKAGVRQGGSGAGKHRYHCTFPTGAASAAFSRRHCS